MKFSMWARQPFDRLDESDVRRLVILSSLGMGGIGAVLLIGVIAILGVVDSVVVAIGFGCAGILIIPPLMQAGLPVRGGAWIFVVIMLSVTSYASLDPSEGVTSGLLMFLSALMLFTGAALGPRALLAVGLTAVLGVVAMTAYDLSRMPLLAANKTEVGVILSGVKHSGAVLISVAMVLGALAVFSRAMGEVRKARDEANRASAVKSAFLANTSHEIRTPLNGVLGMAEVLSATNLTPVQRSYLDTISESGRTLLAMLNDVLDLSKVEAGQLAVVTAPMDIRRLLAHTIAPWRPAAEQKGLALSLQIDADLPKMLEIDQIRLRQCVENLVSNAIKFTDAGSLRLHAQGRGSGAEHVLKIEVEDTGAGIPADQLPCMFEPFRQLAHPDRPPTGGTGLGLTIVRNLAQLMGGELTGISEVGRGSTFTLTIRAPAAAQPLAAASPSTSLLLLCADAENRKTVRAILEQTGRAVAEAEDLTDALAQGASARFDGVLIEMDTPGVDNPSLIDRLRRNRDGGERGMIFIGGAPREKPFDGGFDLKNCVFVEKPLRKARLAAAAEAIERRSALPDDDGFHAASLAGRGAGGLLSAAPPP